MIFSDTIAQTGNLVEFSPTGDLVAVAKSFELKIFETNSLRQMHYYQFVDIISHLDWSSDSNFILAGI